MTQPQEEQQPERRRVCTDCVSHLLMEERYTNLQEEFSLTRKCMVQLRDKFNDCSKKLAGVYVAGIVAALFVGIIVTIIFTSMSAHRADASEEMTRHKQGTTTRVDNIAATMRSQNEIMAAQVSKIEQNVAIMSETVAVMAKTYEMSVAETRHELESTKTRLKELEKVQAEKERRIGIVEEKLK